MGTFLACQLAPLLMDDLMNVRTNIIYENHDIAIAMSSIHADPVLGLNILLH